MKSKQVIAKYEGHEAYISGISFSNDISYAFASSAKNECLLWNPKDEIASFK